MNLSASQFETSDLPKGWVQTTLKDVCLQPQYGWTTSAVQQGRLRLLRTTDITSGKINWECVPFCEKEPDYKSKYLLEDGDIVISRAGSVGFSLLIKNPKESVFASYLIRFKPLIDKDYAAYFLKTPAYWGAIYEKKLGIALANVNATKLKEISIPVAPLNEQKRIVAKIEELFTKLDAGVEALKKIKAQLKRYRQAVLKHAFEGKLTEEWRENNKDKLEPASKLLERIAKEREKNAKGKIRKLPPLDTSGLPELPDGWEWANLPLIVKQEKHSIKRGPFGSAIKKAFFVPSGYKVYEQRNAIYNDFVIGTYYINEAKFNELKAFEVRAGDLIISCSGTIGRIAIVPDNAQKGIINQALLKITLNNEVIATKYFVHLFSSYVLQQELLSNVRGSAMLNISSVEIVKQIPFALAPIQEQQKIVEEIERHFSIADEVEQAIEQGLKQAERLRQSILKRAFEGKLVEQTPEDEPAEKLLERIKAEKARLNTKLKMKRNISKEPDDGKESKW